MPSTPNYVRNLKIPRCTPSDPVKWPPYSFWSHPMRQLLPAFAILLTSAIAQAAALQVANTPVEIVVSEVSARNAKIDILPLDNAGKPLPSPPSTVFVDFPATEKFRTRDLDAPKVISLANAKITISPSPLTIALTNS